MSPPHPPVPRELEEDHPHAPEVPRPAREGDEVKQYEIEQLLEPHREVLRLAEYEGLWQKEIAGQLGTSLTCMKSRAGQLGAHH